MLKKYEIHRGRRIFAVLKLCICVISLYMITYYMPLIFTQMEQIRPFYTEPMLRIVANSNTAADQQMKQQIVQDIQTLPQPIQRAALADYLAQKYAHIPLQVSAGVFAVPPKKINERLYPQVRTESFVVAIGQGRGDNWFCTVYPKSCGKQDKEPIRFALWEWLKKKRK